MNRSIIKALFIVALPLAAQQPSSSAPPPLELSLRCGEVQTAPQSRAVKSAAYGFGNPTNPDSDEFTKRVDRVVFVEIHGETGRVYLPHAVLAEASHPATEGWFPLGKVTATPDVITATLYLAAPGQTIHIDRRTGAAELVGYSQQPLKGVCRVNRKPQQF